MATPRLAAPLLTPSLGNAERLDRPPGERPWRLQSQFLLSFYGGVLPLTWIAYKNAGRLGLPRQTQIKIAAAGAGMMLLLIAIIVVIFANHDLAVAWLGGERKRVSSVARLLIRAGGVLLYVIVAAWQKAGDRRYATLGTGEYDSLWRPGLIASVVADVALIAVLLPLLMLFA